MGKKAGNRKHSKIDALDPAAADRPLLAGHCRPDAQALQRIAHPGFLPG